MVVRKVRVAYGGVNASKCALLERGGVRLRRHATRVQQACGDKQEDAPRTLAIPTPSAWPAKKEGKSTKAAAALASGAIVVALGVYLALELVAHVPRSIHNVPPLHDSAWLMLMGSTQGVRPPSEYTRWIAIVLLCPAPHEDVMHYSRAVEPIMQSKSPAVLGPISVGSAHPLGPHPNVSCGVGIPALPTHSQNTGERRR